MLIKIFSINKSYFINKFQLSKFKDQIWFFSAIHESGTIPSSKQKGALKSCRKGEVFKVRKEADKRKFISKKCIVSGKAPLLKRDDGRLPGRFPH